MPIDFNQRQETEGPKGTHPQMRQNQVLPRLCKQLKKFTSDTLTLRKGSCRVFWKIRGKLAGAMLPYIYSG